MTNAEAIKIINCYDIGFYDLSGEKIPADKLAEAFDMAIDALQRTPNAFPTHECVKPTHECISRQAALDAISTFGNREYRRKQGTLRDAYKLISALPSEPVGKSDTLNRTCANCKHYTEEHLCVFWSYFGFEPNDCCSRWEGADDDI